MPLLEVKDVRLYYSTTRGIVRAVDSVDLSIDRGETLAIVGESGCGKSSLAYTIIRVLPRNVHTYSGRVVFDGVDIVQLSEEEFRRRFRWRRISMVFQGAMNALNPVMRVGDQVAEPLVIHEGMEKEEALKLAMEALTSVGLTPDVALRYPHQLSGGMKQRVVIAMALIMKPDFIILDEPTSALDVITQANIMNLLKRLKQERKLSYMFITHDISLASELADKVAVMYAGKIFEVAPAEKFYKEPLHPYAQKLLGATPTLREDKKIDFIPGEVPSLISPPPGCRFHPRCPYAMDICKREEPKPRELPGGHVVSCWLY